MEFICSLSAVYGFKCLRSLLLGKQLVFREFIQFVDLIVYGVLPLGR